MSRTLSPAMAQHLAGTSLSLCFMLLLELRDGSSLAFTDHDEDLVFDLGAGPTTYRAGTGVLPTDIVLSTGLDADNCELSGPIASDVTLDAVLGGRFDTATASLFMVNWRRLSAGPIRLLKGHVSEARVEGGRFVFEVRSAKDGFNQTVGRTITNNCDADYGDARCGATPESVLLIVTGTTSAIEFDASYPGSFADSYFDVGTVEAQTGALAGTKPVEIHSWTEDGHVILFAPLVETPAIGDTLLAKRGCGKARTDCMARNNIRNFRGFPEVPGSDQVLRATIPGEANV